MAARIPPRLSDLSRINSSIRSASEPITRALACRPSFSEDGNSMHRIQQISPMLLVICSPFAADDFKAGLCLEFTWLRTIAYYKSIQRKLTCFDA